MLDIDTIRERLKAEPVGGVKELARKYQIAYSTLRRIRDGQTLWARGDTIATLSDHYEAPAASERAA